LPRRENSQDVAMGLDSEKLSAYYQSEFFSEIAPIRQSREATPGLHRPGLGLPAIGAIVSGGANSPPAGYRVPLTILALPKGIFSRFVRGTPCGCQSTRNDVRA
jgi:hypothetical protein